jgi:AcrR family transcriptional regulator
LRYYSHVPDHVKSRSYDNSRRTATARTTRCAIVTAARELFLEIGYPATTLAAIAARADVSVQTVYFQFGNKRALLKDVVDQTIAGDDEARPLNQREWVQQIMAESDPRKKLRLFAHGITRIMERVAPIDRMLRSAAEVDPEAAEQRAKSGRQRHIGMSEFADNLHHSGHLRSDLTPVAAAERVAILTDPELFRLTTDEHNWTPAQYEDWLYELLVSSLLDAPASPRRAHDDVPEHR